MSLKIIVVVVIYWDEVLFHDQNVKWAFGTTFKMVPKDAIIKKEHKKVLFYSFVMLFS